MWEYAALVSFMPGSVRCSFALCLLIDWFLCVSECNIEMCVCLSICSQATLLHSFFIFFHLKKNIYIIFSTQ